MSLTNKGYTPHERLSLKNHPEFTEKWVQDLIANDPTVLGLGDLVMRDRERIQPRAGRLDLLLQDPLQDPETKRRYEVELQLGETDEAHIIRTIEYWDIERKRYPLVRPLRSSCCGGHHKPFSECCVTFQRDDSADSHSNAGSKGRGEYHACIYDGNR